MNVEAVLVKQQILSALEILPEDTLREVQLFLDYLRFRQINPMASTIPFQPVKLGGLLEGYRFDDETIAEARREMWGNFGEADE